MLGTIEELEKSIEEFQNNIAASGELCRLLEDYVQQAKRQEDSFNNQARNLLQKVEETPTIIDNQMKSRIAQCSEELAAAQKEMKTCEEQLEHKYREFAQTLDAMNVSNLYQQNQELKKTLNRRTVILTLLSIVAVIVGIVGLFI